MINLFGHLFKKGSDYNYVIAEYRPTKMDVLKMDLVLTEYELHQLQESIDAQTDEMQIDNIYQRM